MPSIIKGSGLQGALDFFNKFAIIAVVALAVGLALFITLTVFGHKARQRCLGTKNPLAVAVLIALVFMWLGGLVPFAGPFIAGAGMLATIILIFVSYAQCKPNVPVPIALDV